MSLLKKMNLFYNWKDKVWSLKYPRQKRLKTFYWGAHSVPIPFSYGSKVAVKQQTIPFKGCYQVFKNKIHVGPLIGILTSKGKSFPFAGNRRNFIDLSQASRQNGAILFVFTPENIDWVAEQMTGWIYDAQDKVWKDALFPFPNVIYNRVSTREKEEDLEMQKAIQLFNKNPQVVLFNQQFFNKQEIYQLLKDSNELKQYLPETLPLTNTKVLTQMLQKYPSIYLKPTNGKAGLGIIKINYEPRTGLYQFISQQSDHMKSLKVKRIEKVWSLYEKYRTSSPYIVQQGIKLESIKGYPFDFRILVQKNKSGKWEVTGVGTRVAGADRITTHVPRGGRIEKSLTVLEQLYPRKAEFILQKLNHLALAIAQKIEHNYIHLGEMSMDIGIDQQRNLWFFEANSKPMKFDESNIRSKSLQNIIEYSQYLTFNNPKG